MRINVLLAAFCLTLGLGITSCGRTNKAGTINIIGSDTMVNLVQSWAEEFMKIHPEYLIAVTGGGSGTGIASLISGSCDIASASRNMKSGEIDIAKKNNRNPQEFTVGLDGIAVVVNPANEVSELTMGQLADIFTGKITDWSQIGGKKGAIVILSREVNSGTHIYFKEHVLQKGDSKTNVEFASSALMLSSSQAIADEVSGNPDAIGYYGMGYINPKQKALKIAKDKSSEYFPPDMQNVVSGKYPISRPLFLYTAEQPQGIVKEFIDFALSPHGQEIVKVTDFVPVKTTK